MAILDTWAYGTASEKLAAENAAKLVDWTHDKSQGTNGTLTLIREWPNMDARYADDFAAALTDTVASPLADGQTYSGTWQSQKPQIIGSDDRAVTVRQPLVKPDTTGLVVEYARSGDTNNADGTPIAGGTDILTVKITYKWNQTQTQYNAIVTSFAESRQNKVVIISAPETNRNGLIDFNYKEMVYLKRSSAAGFVSKRSVDAVHTTELYIDDPTEPTALTSSEYGSFSKQKNEKGSWDGHKTTVNDDYWTGLYVGNTTLKFKEIQRTGQGDLGEYCVTTYTFAITYFNTPNAGEFWISGGFKGSNVAHVKSLPNGGGIWRAMKIYKIEQGAIQQGPINENA